MQQFTLLLDLGFNPEVPFDHGRSRFNLNLNGWIVSCVNLTL
jgi:hypothetical protein